MPRFGKTSLSRLEGLNPLLLEVLHQAIKGYDFTVLSDGGLRTPERQKELVDSGASKNINSNHLTGRAVDIAPYPVRWPDKKKNPQAYVKDMARFYSMQSYIKGIADSMGINLRFGMDWDGDWDFSDQTFDDLPHIEIQGG